MKFEDFLSAEAFAHAEEKKAAASISRPQEAGLDAGAAGLFRELDPRVVDHFINLQTKTWKDGVADNRQYARALWSEFAGASPEEDDQAFRDFEGRLIVNLHNLDIKKHVYPDVVPSFGAFIRNYGDKVKNIALWSSGDVRSTGHQIAKVERSGVVKDFLHSLRSELPKAAAKDFIDRKTSYFVDEDKFGRMAEYVSSVGTRDPEGPIKVVIVDDLERNFQKAGEALGALEKPIADRVEIIPIWAAYSRHGKQSEAVTKNEEGEKAWSEKREALNAIDSFSELADDKRFGPVFRNAHVFVDFDGVISNDATRRVDQVAAVIRALQESSVLPQGELVRKIREKTRADEGPRKV